ncbi:MAG: NUDIX domain-containing protein [Aeromonadales bacterium]|nr:NUDIX domain-containing protein [Aeromonadales bacterium]
MTDDNLFSPRFTIKDVNIHKKERIFKKYFAIDEYQLSYKRFDGTQSQVFTREIFERDANAVGVLIYDVKTDEVALIEQFRPGALNDPQSPWLIEIVAGMVDSGESNIQAAVREVKEEIGLEIKESDLHLISSILPSPGGISEKVTVYIAKADLSKLGEHGGLASEGEDIRIFKAKFDDAYMQVENGRVHNAIAMLSLMYLKLHKSAITQSFA